MKSPYILSISDPRASITTVGGKGASLARMARAGLAIPGGFYLSTEAYQGFVAANGLQPHILAALEQVDAEEPGTLEEASQQIRQLFSRGQIPPDIADAIVQAYVALPGEDPAVAVRSSATAEDLPDASFAGQQETYLNIIGPDAVLEATKKCWASLWTARAIGYRMRQGIPSEGMALAVVVQLLVPAEAAGILFTANPMNGRRDQAVISAGWGLGDAVVGGLVTPDSLTLDKATGRVLERQTADKQVMTVRTDGGTEERSVPESLRRAPVLSDEAAGQLTHLAVKIEDLYGIPMDIEWALAEGQFSIVQARPITALPVPEPPAPTEWKLPKHSYIAMRNNIIELMAEPLTPLFGTLGRSAVNASMGRQMASFFGRPGVAPEELVVTVNEYAYYNGSLSPGQMAWIFLDSVGIMKRMFTGAVERWVDVGRPRYVATVERWQAKRWREFSATELLSAVRELSEAAIDAYMALVSGVIPAAWITEALFTIAYDKLIKRRDDPTAPTYLLGFDSAPIRAEKSLYDLAEWVRARGGLAIYLNNTPAPQLATQLENGQTPPGVDADDWLEWQRRFRGHLQRYGHTIYNLDFANPVPADDPAPLLDT
ncbi:MAG: phosphoenolpyruvate synthase, partial [Anaerolineae bacterium]|nr:phosphoenolpyruvate synthase [Anaerolineae bacterium]NIN98930.1 phosphoenolpyruvate synthase [Anaerolineae bacterium]